MTKRRTKTVDEPTPLRADRVEICTYSADEAEPNVWHVMITGHGAESLANTLAAARALSLEGVTK